MATFCLAQACMRPHPGSGGNRLHRNHMSMHAHIGHNAAMPHWSANACSGKVTTADSGCALGAAVMGWLCAMQITHVSGYALV